MKRAPRRVGAGYESNFSQNLSRHSGRGMIVMASSPESSSGQAMWQKNQLLEYMKRAMRKISHKGE